MTSGVDHDPVRTLTFGGPDNAESAVPFAGPSGTVRRESHAARRSAAHRARQRRRAAQRRYRVRMRNGSEPLLAFLVLLGLTLLLIDLRTDGSAYAGARSAAAGIAGPLQGAVAEALGPEQADADLVAQAEQLQADLAASDADRARLAELESILGIVGRSRLTVVPAAIVALDSGAGTALTATIDRGSDDRLAVDQAVIAGGGLAGRVLSVAPGTAVVRLAPDPQFAVGGSLVGTGEAGIVRGTGDPGALTLELLDPLADVSVGDAVATYGSPGAGPFPPGLAVGEVVDVGDPADTRRTLVLQPAVDATALSVVAVVVQPDRASPAPVVAVPVVPGVPGDPAEAEPATHSAAPQRPAVGVAADDPPLAGR